MAGGRRLSRGPKNLVFPGVAAATATDDRPTYNMTEHPRPEPHIRIPPLPRESPLVFEIITALHATLFTALQFVHLYRTVWWLPQSFNSVGVNLHMIEPWLLVFISAVLYRRVIYLALKRVLPGACLGCVQVVLTVVVLGLNLWPAYRLWEERGALVAYLFVPYLWYSYVFGFSMHSLWEIEELDHPSATQYHICSGEAPAIREQVDCLRRHFNSRLKKMIALAGFITYYSTFIPWCFAQTYVHYDLYWVSQHLLLTFFSVFSLLLSRGFCPDFSDSLHKTACHLGKWTRLRPNHIPSQLWSGDDIFSPGSIVKHQRELYKAEGLISAASEPGNPTHHRFQSLFSGSGFPKGLLCFHVAIIFLGLLVLARTTEWYQVVSVSCVITCGLYTFTRLLVNFLVLFKMYQAEEILFRHGH